MSDFLFWAAAYLLVGVVVAGLLKGLGTELNEPMPKGVFGVMVVTWPAILLWTVAWLVCKALAGLMK